jgi:pyruvate formate-lyase/glycerol dehydratase family glycyl radical enzyme
MPPVAATHRTEAASQAQSKYGDDRIQHLKARVLEGPCTPTGWRLLAFCEGALQHAGGPLVQRRAAGFARTVELFPALIYDDELIVGTHHFGEEPGIDGRIDFPDMNPHLLCDAIETLEQELAKTALPDDAKEKVLGLRGRRDLFATTYHAPERPQEVRLALEAVSIFGWGRTLNHSVRDFAKVLRVGFEGIEREVDEQLAAIRLEAPDDLPRLMFLQAAKTVAGGCQRMGRKYAAAARELAAQTTGRKRKRELLDIAEVCERVPAGPARTLREAIQSLWFAHILTCTEDQINANSIGRIDQILWPYYEADLAAGRLDEAGALELLKHLWLKLWRGYDVQQMQVGGLTPEGEDATNPISYLALQATEELGLVRCLSVRVHRQTPRPLLDRAVDLVSKGGGVPFFFNDEAIIPALQDKGIPLEDARSYAIIGCVEVTIPGRTTPHAVSHNTNLAKCLELALHDGFDPRTGRQVGPHTGCAAEFGSAEELWQAYRLQAEHICRVGAFLSNAGQLDQMSSWPKTYESILTDDCIRRGLDLNAGGAVYTYHSVSAIGIPNVADSLWAVEKLVFDEGALSMADLVAALDANFEGHEPVRQMLLNRAEKYGNDCAEVDGWAARVAAHFCDTMSSHKTWFGGSFHVHLFSFLWNVNPCGDATGALPDGRRAWEPLAYSLSATAGRDRRGITAFFNSLARIPHHKAAGSSSAIIEINPSFLRGQGRAKFLDVLQTAIASGVGQMQFNVVSADRLRQAQEDPEHYGNIIVRVSGFSQEFRLVHKALQDHIIERTKHEG